ncbi:unnamed protein product [Sphagnum balticum]
MEGDLLQSYRNEDVSMLKWSKGGKMLKTMSMSKHGEDGLTARNVDMGGEQSLTSLHPILVITRKKDSL